MRIFIENYIKLKQAKFAYNEPDKITGLKSLYVNTNKDDIKNLLNDKLCIGDKIDYVKLTDIKKILKSNGYEKDKVSIKYIVQDTFPDSFFYERREISGKNHSNVFINIKLNIN